MSQSLNSQRPCLLWPANCMNIIFRICTHSLTIGERASADAGAGRAAAHRYVSTREKVQSLEGGLSSAFNLLERGICVTALLGIAEAGNAHVMDQTA